MVWFEVAFGYIGLMLGSVWQYVIPRTVLGWSRTGHGFVPFLGASKVRIGIDDYTSVIEQFVFNHVTDRKTGARHSYHWFMPNPQYVPTNENTTLSARTTVS